METKQTTSPVSLPITVEAGRCFRPNGARPIATLHGVTPYNAVQLDQLAHHFAHVANCYPDLLAALEGLMEHCAMVHKHWGENSNAREADAAQDAARAAIAKARGR